MSETLKALRSMTDDELIKNHDELAVHTQVGTNHYLQELARRDSDKVSKAVLAYTKWITVMTLVILVATLVNVILFVVG